MIRAAVATFAVALLTAGTCSADGVTSQPNPATRNQNNVVVVCPAGYYTVSAGGTYQIAITYGTYVNGTFQQWNPGAAFTIPLGSIKAATARPIAYTAGQNFNLINAPADLVVRATLQKDGFFGWSNTATSDYLIP